MARLADEKDGPQRREMLVLLDEAIDWAATMLAKAAESKSPDKKRRFKDRGKKLIKQVVRLRTNFITAGST